MRCTPSTSSLLVLVSLAACHPPGSSSNAASRPGDAPSGDPADDAGDAPEDTGVGTDGQGDTGFDADDPRAQLYAELRAKVELREAFSPPKEDRLGLDVLAEMDAAAPELRAAESDVDLYYALMKVGAARRDRHLRVVPADGGLEIPGYGEETEAPLRFAADYGTAGAYGVFVTDLDPSRFDGRVPALGDRVVAVNGRPLAEHVADVGSYYSWSTVENLWWHVADGLHERNADLPPDRFADAVTFELQAAGEAAYTVTVPYLPEQDIAWSGSDEPAYPDMELAFATDTYDLYRHTAGRDVLLLQWHGFGASLEDDVDRLVEYADGEGLLGHALILDATGSRGGSRGAYALQRLTGRAFTCTFGNLRLSDIVPAFIDDVRQSAGGSEADARLVAWLEGPVTDAYLAGEAYSENVPFKLVDLPADSDGVLEPAALHFEGPLVALFGPGGGSHLDQFAAMIVDNDLGYTIGMSTGGFSNTWEWTETVNMPGTERPLVDFMWSIGQTIRPNGEVLEGNPAAVDERVPPTAETWPAYHALLLERAYAHLDAVTAR